MNQFEEQLFLFLKELIETRRENTKKDLPDDYVAVDIKTASLVGIIMWWIWNGLHFVQIISQIKFISCTKGNKCKQFIRIKKRLK